MDARRIGDLLVDAGIISRQRLEEIVLSLPRVGERRVISELLSLGVAQERVLCEALAARTGVPVLVIGESTLDLRACAAVPESMALALQALPVAIDDDTITVVSAEVETQNLIEPLRMASGRRVVPVLGVQALLERAIPDAYAAARTGTLVLRGARAVSPQPSLSLATWIPEEMLAGSDALAREVLLALEDEMPAPPPTTQAPSTIPPAAVLATSPTPMGTFGVASYVRLRPQESTRVELQPDGAADGPAPSTLVYGSPTPGRGVPLAALKLQKRPAPPPPPAPTAAPASGAPVVLVVEDEEAIRLLLSRALGHDGAHVVAVESGDRAVAWLRAHRPALVVLDAMLPVVHGFEICSALKRSALYRDIPVVMISAVYRGLDQSREIQEVHGADAFIEKPFEVNYVRKLVGELLARPLPKLPMAPDRQAQVDEAQFAYEVQVRLGNADEAWRVTDRWLAYDPFDAQAWFERGNLCSQRGDLVGALSAYEAATVYDPTTWMAWINLALTGERLGFFKKARGAWLRARALVPDEATRKRIEAHLAGWQPA